MVASLIIVFFVACCFPAWLYMVYQHDERIFFVHSNQFLRMGLDMVGLGRDWKENDSKRRCRQFKSLFGTSPDYVEIIWSTLMIKRVIRRADNPTPRHLLWALFFLKTYPTNEHLRTMARERDHKTLRKLIWTYVAAISTLYMPFHHHPTEMINDRTNSWNVIGHSFRHRREKRAWCLQAVLAITHIEIANERNDLVVDTAPGHRVSEGNVSTFHRSACTLAEMMAEIVEID